MFNDFAGEGGDIYNFISLNHNRCSFKDSVKIGKDILSGVGVDVVSALSSIVSAPVLRVVPETLVIRSYFKEYELKYWGMRGITAEHLVKEGIHGLEELKWPGVDYISTSTLGNPTFIYLYEFSDTLSFKKYSPLTQKGKWLSSGLQDIVAEDDIFNDKHRSSNKLVIFSSKKDKRVCINTGLFDGWETTSLIAEGNFRKLIAKLKENISTTPSYDEIIYLGDFDDATQSAPGTKKGIERSKQIEEESGGLIKSLYLDEKLRQRLLKVKCKDYDDVRVMWGEKILKEIIKQITQI